MRLNLHFKGQNQYYPSYMKIVYKIEDLKGCLTKAGRIGFVPTMGFLHPGHLSLIRQSKAENKLTVCSIFVNPIQFNNPQDLEKYPRDIDNDCKMLESEGCDLVFIPSVKEMYPTEVDEKFDFGEIEQLMEGEHRPGHFNGVGIVVRRLFDIVGSCNAYFGEKDFQQLLIVKKLIDITKQDVCIIGCPIVREADGLAMSSRNVRLTPADRKLAPSIFKIINQASLLKAQYTPEELIKYIKHQFSQIPQINVEYVSVASSITLKPINHWKENEAARIFIAVWLGGIRLIDNVPIN